MSEANILIAIEEDCYTVPYGATPARVQVITVAARLRDFRRRYEQTRDPRAVFTYAYERITCQVRGVIKRKGLEDGFKDNEWLANLDEIFAQYYFDALDAFDRAQVSEQNVPRLWEEAFDRMGAGQAQPRWRPKTSTLEALLLALIVHTVHDLPLAVAQVTVTGSKSAPFTCDGTALQPEKAAELRLHLDDFNRINNLLLDEIDQVQREIFERYDRSLSWLDGLLGKFDEALIYRALQLVRGVAWYDALRLLEAETPAECEAIRRSIETRTAAYLEMLHQPPSLILRLLQAVYRFLSGLAQRWPAQTTK